MANVHSPDVQELLEFLGDRRTMELTCSFKNCGKITESILDSLKHYERTHVLIATATSSFFIDQKKDVIKLFYYETPKTECNLVEVACIKHVFPDDEIFNKYLRSNNVRTNFYPR